MIYYIIYYFVDGGTIFLLIYLDNAATTKPIIGDLLHIHESEGWYNPSAAYAPAAKVFVNMKETRGKLTEIVGIEGSVVFTSGGTEANNTVILSAYKKNAHYVTSAAEHPSVYAAFKQLEEKGAIVDYVKPKDFCVEPQDVAALIKENTAMVSIMHVNNETGAINDIRSIASAVKAKNAQTLVHSDGVQALRKIDIELRGSEVDYYTVSAHKINALKGVGALIVRKGKPLNALHYGGEQELGLRPGTENTLGIQSFGQALFRQRADNVWIEKLRDQLEQGLSKIKEAKINTPCSRVPHIVSVSFEGLRAEVLVRLLGEKGIYIGTGAACSKGKISRVLLESGVERRLAEGTVRISMGEQNTSEEIAVCLRELECAVQQLGRFNRN
jgi:cysteine desulfurase